MGKGTVTFEDAENDQVNVSIAFDPPLDVENDQATPAQWMLMEKWDKLQKEAVYEECEKYSDGWRPESKLKTSALAMLEIIFDETATIEECEGAATTLVEIIYPEVLAQSLNGNG